MDASQSDFGSKPAPKSVTVTILKDTPEDAVVACANG